MKEEKVHINKVFNIDIFKRDEKAVIPSYAHDGDVGMDLTAIDIEYNEEKDMYIYHTGLTITSNKKNLNVGVFIFPRSSNVKTECYLPNSVGIIDILTYRGEILVCFKSRRSYEDVLNSEKLKLICDCLSYGSDNMDRLNDLSSQLVELENKVKMKFKNFEYAPYKIGDKVAQMVLMIQPKVKFTEIFELDETERGNGGFGSTNNKKR